MQALILAGGFGTRVASIANGKPKSLLEVAGKPIIEHQIELLHRLGITDIRLSLHYKAQDIIDFCEARWPGQLHFFVEETPLGTGGAMRFATADLPAHENVLVFNCDNLIGDLDLDGLLRVGANALACVYLEDARDYGLLNIEDDRITAFLEKPKEQVSGFINSGWYLLHPAVVRDMPSESFMLERDVFPRLAAKGKLKAHHHRGYWIDAGTAERVTKAHADIGAANFRRKRLVAFDLDGTLAKSKQPLDEAMSRTLSRLLSQKHVAVLSGGDHHQMLNQFLKHLGIDKQDHLRSLFLFPTCASSFCRYVDGWTTVYQECLSPSEKEQIRRAFEETYQKAGVDLPETTYGERLGDRQSQITFSAYGQEAPLEIKSSWDPDRTKRTRMQAILQELLPEFEVRVGGTSSIDVTRKGVDKAYGIAKIEEHVGVSRDEILFFGDAIFPGGNDYAVKEAGVDSIAVSGPEETRNILEAFLDAEI